MRGEWIHFIFPSLISKAVSRIEKFNSSVPRFALSTSRLFSTLNIHPNSTSSKRFISKRALWSRNWTPIARLTDSANVFNASNSCFCSSSSRPYFNVKNTIIKPNTPTVRTLPNKSHSSVWPLVIRTTTMVARVTTTAVEMTIWACSTGPREARNFRMLRKYAILK